jgi:hypothetical protein
MSAGNRVGKGVTRGVTSTGYSELGGEDNPGKGVEVSIPGTELSVFAKAETSGDAVRFVIGGVE